MNNIELIKAALIELIENKEVTKTKVERYFSPEYKQCVDGKYLDFAGFFSHLESLHRHTKSMRLNIINIASNGEFVFTKHKVCVSKNSGEDSVVKVLAEFRLKDGKIIYCDELTIVEQGDSSDKELASITD